MLVCRSASRGPATVVLGTALLAAGRPAMAGIERWTPFGQGGGTVRSISIDPAAPHVLYVLLGGSAMREL
jgi:hypothetical protein